MDSTAILESIKSTVNDEGLTAAMAHPDWAAAYEDTLDNLDLPFREKDVKEEVTLLYVLTQYSFFVENGMIFSESRTIATDPYAWKNGEWVSACDL